jgi:hypothetical protein
MGMAGKTVNSTSPGVQLRDASASVSGRSGQGARVTTPKPGVGRPAAAVAGPKPAAAAPDFRDKVGDADAAGMGPSAAAMRGSSAGAC